MTYTKRFTNEAAAEKYWDSIGYLHNGEVVVLNELEYMEDGTFVVVTVTRK